MVPHRPGRATLAACVEGLLSRTRYPDFEVIVVADAVPSGLPAGTVSFTRRRSMVGTSTCAPSAASGKVTGTLITRSSPLRV